MTTIEQVAAALSRETVFAADHIRRWLARNIGPDMLTIEQASTVVRLFSSRGAMLPHIPSTYRMETDIVETDWRELIVANAASVVVEAVAIGNGGEGAYYTLDNGRVFRISSEDCRKLGPLDWGF